MLMPRISVSLAEERRHWVINARRLGTKVIPSPTITFTAVVTHSR